MVNLDDDKMQKIVDDIYYNRCILFLGPMVKCVQKEDIGFSYLDIYSDHVKEVLENENIEFTRAEKGNYYYYTQKYIKNKGEDKARERFGEIDKKIQEVLNNMESKYTRSTIHSDLAKLPFNTIINFGSDTLMTDALNDAGYTHEFHFYDYKDIYQNILKGLENQSQLVYNLFGSDKEYRSKILTETDRLEFMHAIASKPLPGNVLSRFAETDTGTKSFIFLGFDFEEWPFRFLLRLLNMPKNKQTISTNSSGSNIAVFTEEFYNDKFGMEFLNDSNEGFVQKLAQEYEKNYGLHNCPKKAYISYHNDDIKFVAGLKKYLNPGNLDKMIEFHDRKEIFGDVKGKQFVEHELLKYNVYIPFIRIEFLNDPYFLSELQYMLANKKTRIFPIMSGFCNTDNYPAIKKNFKPGARNIFPGENEDEDEMYLDAIADTKHKLDKVFDTIVNTMKSAIR